MREFLNWRMLLLAALVTGAGALIGAIFGQPLLGAAIGAGFLVCGVLVLNFLAWFLVWAVAEFFNSISGRRR